MWRTTYARLLRLPMSHFSLHDFAVHSALPSLSVAERRNALPAQRALRACHGPLAAGAQMEHYIRRMPARAGGTRRVQRCCFIMDMQGFRLTMLPHIKAAIHVLRAHYPGRLGCACFFNTPGYFHPAWKIISPWLDEEILSKTFFLPKSVTDVDKAITWIDRKRLPDPTADP